MTDYFCFENVEPWYQDEVLLNEGFIYYKTPHPSDVTYSNNPVENIRLVKRRRFMDTYSRMVGLEIQQAIICSHAMDLNNLQTFEKVLPSLHTLAFNRVNYSHLGAEDIYFEKKYPIKRLCIENLFLDWDHTTLLTQELEKLFFNKIMEMELDELWISIDMENYREFYIEALRRCKAKSLRIINATLTLRTPNVEQSCRDLIGLKNLSAVMFDATRSLARFSMLLSEIESIRSSKLESITEVTIVTRDSETTGRRTNFPSGDQYKVESILTVGILNKRLHSALVTACIAFNGVGFGIYEMYFILEHLPEMRGHNRFRVLESLEKIRSSINKAKQQTEEKEIKKRG